MQISFQKVPFEDFFHESVMGEFISITGKENAKIIWDNLKEPEKKENSYKLYTPWPFCACTGKQVSVPTGFSIFFEDGSPCIKPSSNNYQIESNLKTGRQVILRLTAKKNFSIGERDWIACCECEV